MSSTSRSNTVIEQPGEPRRLARGIWLRAGPDDRWTRLHRIAEALPPHSVVAGRTAALVENLWLPPEPGPHRVEFASTAPGRGRDMNRTRRPELRGSRRQFRDDEVLRVNGIAMTTPGRTWLDLAGRLRLVELVALGDSVLRSGTTLDDLRALVGRSHRRRGVASARRALPLLDARSRSRPESHMRVELTVPGWPTFEVNEAIADRNGGWLAEPDLSNDEFGVTVEYQGGWHSDDDQMRKDLTRAVTVSSDRWQTLLVGPTETFTHPSRLRTAVDVMLRRGGWSGPERATRPRRVASPTTSGRADSPTRC